jgi:hypothetical protein
MRDEQAFVKQRALKARHGKKGLVLAVIISLNNSVGLVIS